jgi:hypothetical protein
VRQPARRSGKTTSASCPSPKATIRPWSIRMSVWPIRPSPPAASFRENELRPLGSGDWGSGERPHRLLVFCADDLGRACALLPSHPKTVGGMKPFVEQLTTAAAASPLHAGITEKRNESVAVGPRARPPLRGFADRSFKGIFGACTSTPPNGCVDHQFLQSDIQVGTTAG